METNGLKGMVVDDFQYTVQELLLWNKSILDIITKFQDSNARVNRAIIKAVTRCGCLKIDAKKQLVPKDASSEEIKNSMKTHLEGQLCDACRDILEKEIGTNLFYLVSLCNTLDLNIYDIIIKENERAKMLRSYNLE